MDAFYPHNISPSERFLGRFSSQPGTLNPDDSDELHEDEVFWSSDFSSASKPPSLSSPRKSFRGVSEKNNFGILAALPEEGQHKTALRKTSFLKPIPSSLSPSSSTSPSSARMIPNIPKPKALDIPLSSPGGKIVQQSAPVNVPVAGRRRSNWLGESEERLRGVDGEEEEMLPPHEMVSRKHTPVTSLSVLEGAGRTLKGRDLRRVRNAVWRQTGFMD